MEIPRNSSLILEEKENLKKILEEKKIPRFRPLAIIINDNIKKIRHFSLSRLATKEERNVLMVTYGEVAIAILS